MLVHGHPASNANHYYLRVLTKTAVLSPITNLTWVVSFLQRCVPAKISNWNWPPDSSSHWLMSTFVSAMSIVVIPLQRRKLQTTDHQVNGMLCSYYCVTLTQRFQVVTKGWKNTFHSILVPSGLFSLSASVESFLNFYKGKMPLKAWIGLKEKPPRFSKASWLCKSNSSTSRKENVPRDDSFERS